MDRCAFQTENTLCMYRIVFTDPVRMSGRIAVRRTGYSGSLSFSYCCTYSVNSKAKNRRRHYAFSPRLSKKPSRITIAPGGVHGGRGRIFAAENPVFRAASLPCSFCARKSERFQQKLVGVAVAGELAPSSTSSLAFRAVYRLKGAFKARRALSAAFMSGAVPCVCVKEFLIGVGLRRARRGAAVLDVLNQLIGQLLYYVGVLAYQVAALGYVGAQVV